MNQETSLIFMRIKSLKLRLESYPGEMTVALQMPLQVYNLVKKPSLRMNKFKKRNKFAKMIANLSGMRC